MRYILKQLSEPLASIKQRPYHFAVWWLVANMLGLAGFWLPILLVYISGREISNVFINLMKAGSLASFSVIILADGIAALFATVGTGTNIKAAGIKGLFGIVALLLVLISVGILVIIHIEGPNDISLGFQIFLTILAILIASYLYCFRFPDWEKSVDDAKKKEDKEVDALGKKAQVQLADDHGVKL
ncbi:MAG: hypothetical protein KAS87_05770 [Candidatus Omnitrophica bacterium]|nr:hypothetical protein [Candidatus Omnitrophota bacterium]